MTQKNISIRTGIYFLTGIIAFLFVLFAVIQYNNYYYTQKAIHNEAWLNNTRIIPSKIQVLSNRFLQTEVLNDTFYASEKSEVLDSISAYITLAKKNLDSISSSGNYPIDPSTRKRIIALHSQYDKLALNFSVLKHEILNRGYFSTGKSGEWVRFGQYLEDLAVAYNNPVLIKSMSGLNRTLSDYQITKRSEKIDLLLENIESTKVSLNSRSNQIIAGIPEVNRLKIEKELSNFSALTVAIQKMDIHIGFINGGGTISDINLVINSSLDKSNDIYLAIIEGISQSIFRSFVLKMLIIITLGLLYVWFCFQYTNKIAEAIERIKLFATDLTLGRFPNSPDLFHVNEFTDISTSFSTFLIGMREKLRFASRLKSGQIDETLVPLSDDDQLAIALLDVEQSLRKAADEDQKYKLEEQKRAWVNEGLARFSEILRIQTDNLSTLSDEIIVNLVKYLKADVGQVYLYNDQNSHDIHLALISAFAWDRKKFIQKRIEVGEGLVGACAIEKLPIFLTEIPENYIEINSGLGEAAPRCLLLVPLKTEKQIFGVLEIASFNILQPFEIEFVEKLVQSIASTFATVTINVNTAHLLEQSKKQAEEMAQQEEEMRQNLEELQTTQEESARREAEINSLAGAIDASALVIQTDMDGRVTEVNRKFASVVKLHRDEMIGKYLRNIFTFKPESEEFYNLMHDLRAGKNVTRVEEVPSSEGQIVLEIHYSPILDFDRNPYKVLGIATNISSLKSLEQSLTQKEEAFKSLGFNFSQFRDIVRNGFIYCELQPNGTIQEVNENYTAITGFHTEELINQDYRKFLKPDELSIFEIVWTEVMKDKPYQGVFKRTKPTGDSFWLMTSLVPFKDKNGNINKIYFLAQDITEKKLKYQVLEDANKEIERLRGTQSSENNALS